MIAWVGDRRQIEKRGSSRFMTECLIGRRCSNWLHDQLGDMLHDSVRSISLTHFITTSLIRTIGALYGS